MDIKRLTDRVFVSKQISSRSLSALAAQGITTIINNRPDGEVLWQPKNANLQIKAEALGIIYHYLPITSGQMAPQEVEEFAKHLKESTGPVLAFCRTGTRSTTLWAHTQIGHMSANEIIESAKMAGYDLSSMRQRFG